MALILGSPGPLALLLGSLAGVSLGTTAPPLMGRLASSLVGLVLMLALLSLDLMGVLRDPPAPLLVGPMVLLMGSVGLLSLGLLAPLMGLLRPAPLRVDPPALLLVLLVGLVLAPGSMLTAWSACLALTCWFGVWLIGSWRLGWCWSASVSLV